MTNGDSALPRHSRHPTEFSVVYLTGAPASGKSSLCRELVNAFRSVTIFEYGAELTSYLNEQCQKESKISQSDLRRQSSGIASKEDIEKVDERLLTMVNTERRKAHVIVDSHAVTKEHYGFRVTGFELEKVRLLRPSHIVCLYTAPNVIQDRISRVSGGRPLISRMEAEIHAQLQGSVAIGYGLATGAPVYFFDSSGDNLKIVDWFRTVLS